jgi:hypothetical protein
MPRDTLTVARFTAPAWRVPARPRRLRARRKGTTLVVTWRPAAGAARYQLFATSADGDAEAFVLPARRRRLVVKDVEPRDRAVVVVAGLRSDGQAGPSARLALKPDKRRPGR